MHLHCALTQILYVEGEFQNLAGQFTVYEHKWVTTAVTQDNFVTA